jgi:hypothetical protein
MAYDHYCAPPWLAERIGPVHTDPASNIYSFIRAVLSYSGKFGQDGLKLPWIGRTYVNSPYSNPTPWAERWIEYGDEKIWLSEASGGVRWFTAILEHAETVWFFKQRLAFYDPRYGREMKGARAGHILATVGCHIDLSDVAVPMTRSLIHV